MLPGSVSRLKAFVPEQSAEIQQLRERLAEAEARHKTETEQVREGYEAELKGLTAEQADMRKRYEAELHRLTTEQIRMRKAYEAEQQRLKVEIEQIHEGYKAEIKRLNAEQAQTRERYEAELEPLKTELAQLHARSLEISALLRSKTISLAEDEHLVIALSERLRKELWALRKLTRLLDDVQSAAARLRSSRRWKLANPLSAIRAKLSSTLAGMALLDLSFLLLVFRPFLRKGFLARLAFEQAEATVDGPPGSRKTHFISENLMFKIGYSFQSL